VPGGQYWFGNADGFGWEPIPGFEEVLTPAAGETPGEYLMCDVEGPGAIVRLWTATIKGDVRVFLDDAETPLYDGKAEAFFRRPYDSLLGESPITTETLAGTFYQSNAAYAPIAFAKRCRIVWVGNPAEVHFYQIQIRQYAPGTEVVTFSPSDLTTYSDKIKTVASVLADVDGNGTYTTDSEPVEISHRVAAKEKVKGVAVEGEGAVERLVLKVEAKDLDKALRETVLYLWFDDVPWPQVQAPIGDFFGAGPGINPYSSVPFTVAPDGTMTCRYVMPYKKSFRVLFDNRGEQDVSITGSVLCSKQAWDEDSSMHFRAKWRVNHDLVASVRDEMGSQDLPFLLARGKGVLVGTAIMLLNPNNAPQPNGNWWGEGDEKIFVDDDVRPSTFGTGTEDYFNYAWSEPALFSFPYCGQPRNDGPANRGFVVNSRWHVLDPLPFTNNIAFFMELINHGRTEDFSYARIAYHYGREGFLDDHVTITDADLEMPTLPATWEPELVRGAQNWTIHPSEELLADSANTSFEEGPLWQGGRLVVWTPKKVGETMTFRLNLTENAPHAVMLACKFSPDGGTFTAQIDGVEVEMEGKDAVALVSPYHVQSIIVGTRLPLKAGAHTLTLVAKEADKPIGIDFIAHRH